MSFWRFVEMLRQKGLIGPVWGVADLRRHMRRYFAENTLVTVPANSAIDSDTWIGGDYVQKGMAAQCVRIKRGLYALMSEDVGETLVEAECGKPSA